MNKLTASVVGGGVGGRLSLIALAKSDKYELVAAADLSEKTREELAGLFPGIQLYSTHQEMFESCPTDIVCVSTYPPSHESVTLDALKLPLKGILVEKPLGHTAASGRRLLQAIKDKGIPVVVPHGLLAKSTPLEVIQRVQQGEIGQLKLVEIQNVKWDIINAGIHWVHFFVNLINLESIDYVMAICEGSTKTYRDGMQVETTAVTYAQSRSGIRLVMNTGDEVLVNRDSKETLFRLIGDQGQIEFWGWENGYRIFNRQYPTGEILPVQEFPTSGHQAYLERLAEEIHNGTQDYRIADSSLTALEICEAAYLSSKHQAKIKFPLDASQVEPASWEMGIPYSGIGGGRNGRNL